MEKKSNKNKISGLNIFIISIISFLYILLITKLAELISYHYSSYSNSNTDNLQDNLNEENKIGVYVMVIYFISIIGIIVGYIWFDNNSRFQSQTSTSTPTPIQNWIIRWSLSIGGVLMLIYTIINYWEYLNDYSKLLLIFLSITSIIYYLYKYY